MSRRNKTRFCVFARKTCLGAFRTRKRALRALGKSDGIVMATRYTPSRALQYEAHRQYA